MEVSARYGEVVLEVGGEAILDGIFEEDDAEWVAAQWRHKLRTSGPNSSPDAQRFVGDLLDLRTTGNDALRNKVLEVDAKLDSLEDDIHRAEAELDALVYDLYDLTDEECEMVENDKRAVL